LGDRLRAEGEVVDGVTAGQEVRGGAADEESPRGLGMEEGVEKFGAMREVFEVVEAFVEDEEARAAREGAGDFELEGLARREGLATGREVRIETVRKGGNGFEKSGLLEVEARGGRVEGGVAETEIVEDGTLDDLRMADEDDGGAEGPQGEVAVVVAVDLEMA
jgi:hypothetical protein